MLNKISNINAGQDFRKSSKFKQAGRSLGGVYKNNHEVHDSINISPALNFFDDSNWKLKSIVQSSDEKIQLDFRINDYNFSVLIDSTNLNKMSYLKYFTSKIDLYKINQLIQIEVIVELTERYDITSYDRLSMIDMLFSRISRLNLGSEITKEETTQMNVLQDGILTGLQKEYIAISSVVLNFIEKYTGKKVDIKKHETPLFENHILVEKIKIINV